jgi:hypothetical protein
VTGPVFVIEQAPAVILGPAGAGRRVAIVHSIPPDDAVVILVEPERPPQSST